MLSKGARLHGAPDDVDEAVAVRLRRQELLYRPGKSFHLVVGEAVLWSEAAAPRDVMTAQLDRLVAATTLAPKVKFGIVPFAAQWPIFLELKLTRPDEIQI